MRYFSSFDFFQFFWPYLQIKFNEKLAKLKEKLARKKSQESKAEPELAIAKAKAD